MPTENRSSNTEMVSELLPCPFCGQQDFLIERLDSDASVVICQGLTGPHEACLARGPVGVAQDEGEEQPGRDKAVELWNARAEQHQGEPVALPERKPEIGQDPFSNKGWNACLDEIAKLGSLYTRPVQGEPAMWANQLGDTITDKVKTHNLSLGGAPAGIAKSYTQPLYTHPAPANSAEVECAPECFCVEHGLHIETLRAKLAERDALLTRTLPYLSNTPDLVQHGAEDLAEEIRSASAGRPCYGPNEWGTECGKCSKCKPASAEPSEPLPPVDGDLLPPIGSKVLFHLGREDEWVEHTVVGYYVWGNHGLDQNVHRVFVRARDADGYLNARLLSNLRAALERTP